MDLNIEGKKALILGSSSGLGFAIAKALSNEGVHCMITSRELERAEAAASQLSQAKGFACDLLQKMREKRSFKPSARSTSL